MDPGVSGEPGCFPGACTRDVTEPLPPSPVPVTHSVIAPILVDTDDAAIDDHRLVLIGSKLLKRLRVGR